MKLSAPKLQIWLVIALAATFASAIALIYSALTPLFHLEVSMTSSRGGTARAFFDIGAGINGRDSTGLPLQREQRTLYRFPLPQADYRAIHFHPADRDNSEIVIHGIRILDLFGNLVRKFSPAEMVAGNSISHFEVTDRDVILRIATGEKEPILVINPGDPISLHIAAPTRWICGLRVWVACFLPLSVAGILWLLFAPRLWRKVTPGWEHVAAWGRSNPRRVILTLSIISAVVSCYPVVFFGRSFVSANTVPLLYPGIPTLPGYQDTRSEDFKGSDAGATMWHDVPNSFIQSRSLARDGELPLWNRYNSSGVTLLGQGQSMFGDPLHMVVVAAAGEAWAWDLKFLLAKALFCTGLGLAVYASSKNLSVALLLTCSSAFIGFFSYRFNHPAFFSLCYAPWLLLRWFEITRAPSVRSAAQWAAVLLLVSWTELNSGTAKEAYMLLLSLHGCGFLVFCLSTTVFRVRKLIDLAVVGVVLLLIASPVWLTFFDALRRAYVPYKDAARAFQIQPGLLVGFFDDIFYRAVNPGDFVYNPSMNLFDISRMHLCDRLPAESIARSSFRGGRPGGIVLLPAGFRRDPASLDRNNSDDQPHLAYG